MPKEYYHNCKDCMDEFGYSESSHLQDLGRGHSRPERCPIHRRQHAEEVKAIASSHFKLKRRTEPHPILGLPYLGRVARGERKLREVERQPDRSGIDIGITDDNIRDLYRALEEYQVVVIEAPTGAGKSTVIPYRLIEPLPPYNREHFTRRGPVVVTQPRRPATAKLPHTVGEKFLGSSVGPGFEIGYRHRDSGEKHDPRNRLVFVTDGTLLNWLANGKAGDFSVIMIDEAHERSTNIDLLLALLKREVVKHQDLRLIIASATIDAGGFVEYYEQSAKTRLLGFEGKRKHGYDVHFSKGDPIPDQQMPRRVAEKVLELIASTTEGGILAFLQGKDEIEDAVVHIRMALGSRRDVMVFPLYTALGDEKIAKALGDLPEVRVGERTVKPRRVLVATNIAETSLTLPDIVYVVDSGLIKQPRWNPSTCRREFMTQRHSKDGCKQRWGRAGRVCRGEVHTMYTEEEFKSEAFPEHTPPEIVRECLDDVLLRAKDCGVSDIEKLSWIAPPLRDELERSLSAIRQRKLVDVEDDLTAEGLEVFRLAQRVSGLLDKYDGNSTSRALDVASLLVLADRYACLIEAATALAMMPHMGEALYWIDDGLLQWNPAWDLRSKDRVAQIHQALRLGCRDDLDFACKLFALYEGQLAGLPESAADWGRRHFINVKAFEWVNEARAAILERFGSTSLRPLDFFLVPRVRLLMALAWPDRRVRLRPGQPAAFEFIQRASATGVVSRYCRAPRESAAAVVAMMDRAYVYESGVLRERPVANFLAEAPEPLPSAETAEIAVAMSRIRASYDPRADLERLLVDQLVPVGTLVEVHGGRDGAKVRAVFQRSGPFTATTAGVGGVEDVSVYDTHDLYEHGAEGEEQLAVAENAVVETEEAKVPETALEARSPGRGAPEAIALPSLRARWVGDLTGARATVIGWSDEEGGPVALLQAAGAGTGPATVVPGTDITVRLARPVVNMPWGTLAGFIGEGRDGLSVPISVDVLSVPLRNPGLLALTDQAVSLKVIGRVPSGDLLVSRLEQVEKDLEEFTESREIDGRIVEIVKDRQERERVHLAIDRPEGIVHAATVPLERVPTEMRGQMATGERVRLRVQSWRLEPGKRWEVQIYEAARHRSGVGPEHKAALRRAGISYANGVLSTAARVSVSSILPLRQSVQHLFPWVRRLYALSRGLSATILETEASMRTVVAMNRQALELLRRARTDDPAALREQITSFRRQINEAQIGRSSKNALHDMASQASRIQDMRHRQQEIAKLTGWCKKPGTPSHKADQYRQYVAEHRREIERIEPEIESWNPPKI